MRVHATVSALFSVVLPILMTLGLTGRAAADSACIDQPNRDAPPGAHWYYHSDREKNRKCWHLGPAAAVARDVAPLPRAEPVRAAASPLNLVFGPLFRDLRRLFRQPMPHEPVAGEPRIVQSDATRPLTIEDIAQQPEFPEERAEARPAPSLTAAQRRALFEDYLRWEEQRHGRGAAPAAQAP